MIDTVYGILQEPELHTYMSQSCNVIQRCHLSLQYRDSSMQSYTSLWLGVNQNILKNVPKRQMKNACTVEPGYNVFQGTERFERYKRENVKSGKCDKTLKIS